MKFLFIITLAFIISCSPKFDMVRREAYTMNSPEGTVWLRDSLFIGQYEVSNSEWRKFLNNKDLKNQDSFMRRLLLPDTLVWRKVLNFGEPYNLYYFRHPAYNEYPVVGITKLQAAIYCEWKTYTENQKLFIAEKKWGEVDPDTITNFPIHFNYRLPTKKEWEYAASAGLNIDSFPYGYEQIRTEKRNHSTAKFNSTDPMMMMSHSDSITFHSFSFPSAPDDYPPNGYGIYNIIGNVAEMVDETNIVKGGSHYQITDECQIKNDIVFKEPESWIGFRYIAETLNDGVKSTDILLTFKIDQARLRHQYDASDTSITISDLPLPPASNSGASLYKIHLTQFKQCKNLRDLMMLPDGIIKGYEIIWFPATNDNIYLDTPNSGTFTKLMRDLQAKSKSGDVFYLNEIKIESEGTYLHYLPYNYC